MKQSSFSFIQALLCVPSGSKSSSKTSWIVQLCEHRHPRLSCRDQEVQSRKASGVEEDEKLKIMKQKILNNLFSLSAVVLHVAYTLQFKLQDKREVEAV